MKYKVVFIIFLVIIVGILLFSYRNRMVASISVKQRSEVAGRTTTHVFDSDKLSASLPYRLYSPAVSEISRKIPLILYLHGAGGRGDDNYRQLNGIVDLLTSDSFQKKYPSYVLVPQCPHGHQWVDMKCGKRPLRNYDQDAIQEGVYLQMVMKLIGRLKDNLPVDSSRLYVMGFSMGATGTWDIITRHPEEFAAAVILNGRSDPTKAHKIKNLPIMVFHGKFDRVSPINNARQMIEELKTLGSPVEYKELFWGHGITRIAMREQTIFPRLFSHNKKN